jgi:hypothetical protein
MFPAMIMEKRPHLSKITLDQPVLTLDLKDNY